MLPNAIAGAVSVRPQAAGTASGLLGCIQMTIGAAFVQLGGLVLVDATTVLPMALLLGAVVAGFALSLFGLVRPRLFAGVKLGRRAGAGPFASFCCPSVGFAKI